MVTISDAIQFSNLETTRRLVPEPRPTLYQGVALDDQRPTERERARCPRCLEPYDNESGLGVAPDSAECYDCARDRGR